MSAAITAIVVSAFTQKGAAIPPSRDDDAGDPRTEGAADIEADAVEGDGRLKMSPRNQ